MWNVDTGILWFNDSVKAQVTNKEKWVVYQCVRDEIGDELNEAFC